MERKLVYRMKAVHDCVQKFASNHETKHREVLESFGIDPYELPINIGEKNMFQKLREFEKTFREEPSEEVLTYCLAMFWHLINCIEILDENPSEAHVEVVNLLHYIWMQISKVHHHSPDLPETRESLKKKLDKLIETFVSDPEFVEIFEAGPRGILQPALRDYQLSREIGCSLNDLDAFVYIQLRFILNPMQHYMMKANL